MTTKEYKYGALVFIALVTIVIFAMVKQALYPLEYKTEVIEYSNKYNLDPYLVLAIINTESKFDKHATSSQNAKGLMQITDATAEEMNEMTNTADEITDENIYDEEVNIELGCKYLASLINRYDGNYYVAVCAYNAGIGNVNNWIEEGIISKDLDTTDVTLPFSETTLYLKKVIDSYDKYKSIYSLVV